ncbi:YncE family protein [Variovorax atrisoli]|uniref:YncE family protein n=1 Tax=Variovorax atrisoli TaxID=3394203 RepID=UPI003392BBDC
MMLRFAAAIGFCLVLAGCGGGGGGGGGGLPGLGMVPSTANPPATGNVAPTADASANDASSPAVTFSLASVTGNQPTGTSGTYVVKVNVSNPAVFNGTVYAVVQDSKQVLSPGAAVQLFPIDASTYGATLRTSASLPVGRYQGTFQIALCKDPACTQQYPGSPVSLPYDFTVSERPLQAVPLAATSATAHVGGANPPDVSVQIAGPAGNWKASTSTNWLKTDQPEGALPGTVKVRFITQGLTTGRYEDQLVLRSADGQQAKVAFTLEMLPTQFNVSSNALVFSGVNGSTIPSQTLNFSLDNQAISNWAASTTSAWLLIDPTSGTTPGSLIARVDPSKSNLASGYHSASLLLEAPGYPSKTVSTALTLAKPTLSAPTTTITLGGPKGRDEIAQSQSINMSLNTGSNKWPWTVASVLPAWVTASPLSGTVDASGAQVSFTPVASSVAPGSYSTVATVTAKVNGDSVSLPVTLTLNRDQRKLLPSEWGVGFASIPNGSVLTKTLQVTDNFGGALPWTATSSAAWLTVTGSGTTGSGPGLTLSADPALVPLGAVSYATVTLKASNPDAADAVVRVGLWRSDDGLTALAPLPTDYTNVVADKIRPYVYAHNGGTFIDIYNAHLGTKVGTIANVGAGLGDMSVAPDGSLLYVLDKGNGPIVVIDLASASKVATWPLMLKPSDSFQSGDSYPQTLLAIRVNGKNVVLTGNGIAYIDGNRFDALPAPFASNWALTASSDGRRVFAQNTGISPTSVAAYDVDYSAMANGILMVKSTAEARSINNASNGSDIAVNADGTALYTASGAPYRCSSVNPLNLGFVASLPGGGPYPNNVEVTKDGRVLCGINSGPDLDSIWVHDPNGVLLKSVSLQGYGYLHDRQLVVTPDGMMAVGLTRMPRMVFVPLGAP